MDSKLKTIALWAGVGAGVTLSSILVYLMLKQEEEYEVKRRKTETTKHYVIKVTVPKDIVGGVIGRQGGNIKKIQDKTKTKISFEDHDRADECDRVAVIRGAPGDVEEAEELLKACIEEQSNIVTETVFVPGKACGRIIGRNGESVRHMCRVTSAKILVDRTGDDRERDNLKAITITGTREQIRMAVSMIDEKLAEEEAFQQKMALASSAGRAALYRSRPLAIKNAQSPLKDGEKEPDYTQEELAATSADGYIEVFVSSVESPSRFWVQVVGALSTTLDKLVSDMTSYYSHPPNKEANALTSVSIGDLVASPFDQDDCWYRSRVIAIQESDYSPGETVVEVHYADFGEKGEYKIKELCALRDEYHYLPLQAIECSLAGVQPRNGTQWAAEVVEAFETLTHSSQWKVVMAKVVSKAKREDGFPGFQYVVDLVDTANKKDVSVAAEMIAQDLAVQAI